MRRGGGGRPAPAFERFARLSGVQGPGGCIPWVGAQTSRGYGCFCVGGKSKNQLAHRWIYQALVGPIPDGLTIDHLCRNKLCVNPEHLEPVPLRENVRRAHAARWAEKMRLARVRLAAREAARC